MDTDHASIQVHAAGPAECFQRAAATPSPSSWGGHTAGRRACPSANPPGQRAAQRRSRSRMRCARSRSSGSRGRPPWAQQARWTRARGCRCRDRHEEANAWSALGKPRRGRHASTARLQAARTSRSWGCEAANGRACLANRTGCKRPARPHRSVVASRRPPAEREREVRMAQ